jgi:hypothetical protein
MPLEGIKGVCNFDILASKPATGRDLMQLKFGFFSALPFARHPCRRIAETSRERNGWGN